MIHQFSDVHPNSSIGSNTKIEAFTSIAEDVIIGNDCWIGPNATIMNGARIGNKCRIYPGAVIAGEPQDLKFEGEPSTVTIGNNTTIRECVTINRGTKLDKGDTKVGEGCTIMAYSHIAHDCIIGNHVILANAVQMAGHVQIGEYAFIGGTTAIHQFVKIGKHAMVSGGSLVRKDVPPFVTAARDPLSYSGVNSIGLRRRGYSVQKIKEIQDIYRVFYISGLNNTQAIDQIKMEAAPSEERDLIIRFIENSNRGMMKGPLN